MNNEKQFFIGLDVHTKMTQYAVRRWDGEVVSEGSCSTTLRDVHSNLEPYLFSCVVGAEASTSFYPLRDGFLEKKVDFRVANVHQIRKLVAKSDKLDARRLSDMLRLKTFPESYIPSKEVQALRDILTVRHNLLADKTAAQNRIWAAACKAGLRMKWKSLFCKKGLLMIENAIEDGRLAEGHILLSHYKHCQEMSNNATKKLVTVAKSTFPNEWSKLQEISGVGQILASYLTAEIHPIKRFANQKKLRRYAGIIPCAQESGGKTYGNMLPKYSSRSRLRWALTQAAHHAIRKKDSNMRQYYMEKKRHKIKQKVLLAVARITCDKIYNKLNEVRN